MNISINTNELQQLLQATPAAQNVMLVGKHGIGKSEILTAFYASKGQRVVTLFLGQMSDPGDLIGLPTKNEATGKTDFMPPYWFPTDGKPVVLFLDELNRARPEVLQTVMDLTLNRRLADRALPQGSRVIAAVNDGEEYQLTDLDPALVSRFNIYQFRPTAEEWLLWASKNNVDERVVRFIGENQIYLESQDDTKDTGLDKTPDRRAWKHVSDMIAGTSELGIFHKKLIAGIVGVKAATMFFNSVVADNSISGKEAMLNYAKHRVRISKMQLHELSLLNESIFRFIEAEDIQDCKTTVAESLSAYIKMLLSTKKSEAFAHWISTYSSGNYPKTTVFILTDIPDLYAKIQKFIAEL